MCVRKPQLNRGADVTHTNNENKNMRYCSIADAVHFIFRIQCGDKHVVLQINRQNSDSVWKVVRRTRQTADTCVYVVKCIYHFHSYHSS